MRTLSRIVPAGREDDLPIVGRVLTINSLSAYSVVLRVDGEPVTVRAGDVLEYPQGFERVALDNSAGADDVRIEITGGKGASRINRVRGIPSGVPDYQAGAAGAVNVPAGAEVTMIAAHAGDAAGSLQIGSGDVLPIPPNTGFADATTPFIGPLTITFSGTDSCYVGWTL